MNTYRTYDVFTEQPFSGNALAVFPEAGGLSDESMQKIAREFNLSETIFITRTSPSDTAHVRPLSVSPRSDSPTGSSSLSHEIEPLVSSDSSQSPQENGVPIASGSRSLSRHASIALAGGIREIVPDFAVRIFTPSVELPFAGHPLVGAAVHLAQAGLLGHVREGTVRVLMCKAGVVEVRYAVRGRGCVSLSLSLAVCVCMCVCV